jgi:hypothetical protein
VLLETPIQVRSDSDIGLLFTGSCKKIAVPHYFLLLFYGISVTRGNPGKPRGFPKK